MQAQTSGLRIIAAMYSSPGMFVVRVTRSRFQPMPALGMNFSATPLLQ